MAGLSLCLVAAVLAGGWWVLRDDSYVAPPPDAPLAGIRPGEAASTLRQLERAVLTGKPDAAARLAPTDDPDAARLLADVARNAKRIGLDSFSLRYVDAVGGVDAQGRWSATVETRWRFTGVDPGDAVAEVEFRLADEEGRTAVAGIGGDSGRTPTWLGGPLEIRRAAGLLVLAAADGERYARLAEAAVPVVRRVLPAWRGGLVVEVPASAEAVDAALGAPAGEYAAIAAVTSRVGEGAGPRAPVHVVVNPEVFDGLDPLGAQVVMSHEAVHVATGAAGEAGVVPPWLTEGFADYVALRDVDLPLAVTAGQVLRQVRREGPPRRLPDDREFDTRTTHLGAAYEAAWLACRLLAERSGETTLRDFYVGLGADDDVEREFRRAFGVSLAAFTREWRSALSDWAA